jgi:hypothetical protein
MIPLFAGFNVILVLGLIILAIEYFRKEAK